MSQTTSQISINASAEKVWAALTQPELVKKWQYGSNLLTTWQIGSPIKFQTQWEGNLFEQWGTVLDVQPFKELSYSLFAPRPDLEDIPENYFIMKYNLQQTGSSTLLTIIQEDNRNILHEEPAEAEEENTILKGLKDLVEGQL